MSWVRLLEHKAEVFPRMLFPCFQFPSLIVAYSREKNLEMKGKEYKLNALSLFQIFELCSKLKINLSISGLDRINLDSQAIYSIDSGLSNFGVVYYLLGCSLGRDARFVSFWDPDMEKILSILMIEKGLIFL